MVYKVPFISNQPHLEYVKIEIIYRAVFAQWAQIEGEVINSSAQAYFSIYLGQFLSYKILYHVGISSSIIIEVTLDC